MTEPAADTRRRLFQQTQGSPRGAKAVAASGAASAGPSRIRPGATAFSPRWSSRWIWLMPLSASNRWT